MPSKVINSAFLALTFTKCYTIVPCYLGGGGRSRSTPLPQNGCLVLWILPNPICTMFFPKMHTFDEV